MSCFQQERFNDFQRTSRELKFYPGILLKPTHVKREKGVRQNRIITQIQSFFLSNFPYCSVSERSCELPSLPDLMCSTCTTVTEQPHWHHSLHHTDPQGAVNATSTKVYNKTWLDLFPPKEGHDSFKTSMGQQEFLATGNVWGVFDVKFVFQKAHKIIFIVSFQNLQRKLNCIAYVCSINNIRHCKLRCQQCYWHPAVCHVKETLPGCTPILRVLYMYI